jgi:hypothetical protein
MTPRTLLLVVVVAQAGAGASAAQTEVAPPERYNVRLEYLFWSPLPTGEVQKGVVGVQGTLLDLQEDLALAEDGMNPLRGTLRFGRGVKLRASWSPIDFRGETTADRAFVYGTAVVLPGQTVVSSLKGNYITGDIAWDFLERPQGFLGVLGGVKFVDVDALVLNADTSDRVVETERLPIPVLGLAGRAYLTRRISLEGEISGLTLGDRGHVYEVLVGARLHLTDYLAATGGYRKLVLEGRPDDRDFLRIDLGTWTFGAEISL